MRLHAMKAGIEVLEPVGEHGRYDLAFDLGDRIWRIQCKWARRRGEVVIVNLRTSCHSGANGYRRTKYTPAEVDAIAAYSGDLDRCYLIPIERVGGRTEIHLRLSRRRTISASQYTPPLITSSLGL